MIVPPLQLFKKQGSSKFRRYDCKEYSDLVVQLYTVESSLFEMEKKLFELASDDILGNAREIVQTSQMLAELDFSASNSFIAKERNYTRPIFTENLDNFLDIRGGRHPVLELLNQRSGSQFVTNECKITKESKLIVLTGPNMGGKSTYLRQNAIIILMAHAGFFVPAEYAKMSIVDKMFSRLGSADNISQNKSTFMVC